MSLIKFQANSCTYADSVVSVVSVVKESNRPAACRLAALVAGLWCLPAIGQPTETGDFRAPDLVELARLDASIHLDIRYATNNNFTGHKQYTEARAFLQRPAAEALLRAHRALKLRGYGLLVFDGYRPWSVTKAFWDATPPDKHKFVADPQNGSRHNRGCAVDLGLYGLGTGKEVAMPSAFDEMSDRAAADYQGGTVERRRTRALLRQALEKEGFKVNPDEWWHFDYQDWRRYRVLDLPFAEIHASPRVPDAGHP
ncbi:MAG TPA: M15 family metallopeptidase [Polyangia bacterium]|nr:M15 family metallopeptidase [Polyangia bacterium]